jgi:hypothetical protein
LTLANTRGGASQKFADCWRGVPRGFFDGAPAKSAMKLLMPRSKEDIP